MGESKPSRKPRIAKEPESDQINGGGKGIVHGSRTVTKKKVLLPSWKKKNLLRPKNVWSAR